MKKLMTEWRKFRHIQKVNEKVYKQYASRLSEELQEIFWNLSEDQKVFVVEDWISQGRPADHLMEEKMADLDAEQAYSIKVITVMRKDDFQTDDFAGGQQKTYTVQTR
jgi:hypoxanthine-guanine phosphoribosyltransferase